jgi:hypothetical protein
MYPQITIEWRPIESLNLGAIGAGHLFLVYRPSEDYTK